VSSRPLGPATGRCWPGLAASARSGGPEWREPPPTAPRWPGLFVPRGVPVVEVNRPDRAQRRHRGKSDAVDAEAAANAVLSGRAGRSPFRGSSGASIRGQALRRPNGEVLVGGACQRLHIVATLFDAGPVVGGRTSGVRRTSTRSLSSRSFSRPTTDAPAARADLGFLPLARALTLESPPAVPTFSASRWGSGAGRPGSPRSRPQSPQPPPTRSPGLLRCRRPPLQRSQPRRWPRQNQARRRPQYAPARVMIADLLDPATRHPHVVVGGIGAGKTALLVRLTKLLADQRAVPVAVRLRDAETRLDFRKLARERFIADLESRMVSNEEGERVWRQLLREGRIVVLADGLEEALIDDSVRTERDSLIRLAIRQANTARLPLIIASRPHDPLRGTEATIMELEPLSEEAALDYIMRGDQNEEEHRLDWIVETAEVTEAPFYLQIAYQLHRAGLLEDAAANGDDRQPDIRGADRSGLRLRLLKSWEDALLAGHFPPGVALSREDRMATIEQLSALACIGLGQDQLEVKLEDFEALREPSSDSEPPPPIIREVTRRLAEAGDRSFDIRLAATWGTHLGLVEAHGATVSFPNSILQAYLGSRLIAEAMAQREFREKALKNPGRELLIALVMRSRVEPIDAGGRRPAVFGASNGSPPEPISLREHLRTSARGRTDSKALDLYAALLEIDSADLVLEHRAIGDEIVQRWQKVVERDPRTLNDAKLNLVHRFGEAARTISERRSGRQLQPFP
jgi:hypothetical protein